MNDSEAGSPDGAASRGDAVLEADGMRVVFFRRGDRYAHRVEVSKAGQGSWLPVWESLEGTPDDDWPPSPPLQHLHVEKRAEGPVALLVGMAGRTHWSAAVEVVRESGLPIVPRVVRFDIAARVHALSGGPGGSTSGDVPQWLGSAYRRLSSAQQADLLIVRPLDGSEPVRPAPFGDAWSAIRPSGWPPTGSAAARTVGWRYSIETAE
jgi:hypothetical protein